MENVIEIKNLVKNFGKKKVLKNISLTIKEGERVALIGGNGSGKTTLVEIIANIQKETSGEIIYSPNLKIGIQFQESEYPMGVTTNALINFYLEKFGSKNTKEKLKDMVRIFRLDGLLKKQLFEMSGGQKQRINILLALIHNPNFIILDELSTGLDIKIRRELRNFIIKYLKDYPKTSLILVSHSMGEAEELCNRVVVLDWGIVKVDLSMKEVIKKHKSLGHFADEMFNNMYKEET